MDESENLRTFALDTHVIERLRAVRQYGEQNPIDIEDIINIEQGFKSHPMFNDKLTCDIPVGYHLWFTTQVDPDFMVREMGVWVESPDKLSLPTERVLLILMEILGYEVQYKFFGCMVGYQPLINDYTAIVVSQKQEL